MPGQGKQAGITSNFVMVTDAETPLKETVTVDQDLPRIVFRVQPIDAKGAAAVRQQSRRTGPAALLPPASPPWRKASRSTRQYPGATRHGIATKFR